MNLRRFWPLLLLSSCTSVDRFDTTGEAAYCGNLVVAGPFQSGLLPDAAKPPILSLEVKLDTSNLLNRNTVNGGTGESPGEPYVIVGTLRSDDADRGLCGGTSQPLFDTAPLRTIPELDHDLLRSFEFGEGRDYNFMAWVDSSCQGTMLAVISLMRNDNVELRLLKPARLAPPNANPELRPGFGLFHLRRSEVGCAF